jgi:hypothetical protein
MLNAYYLIRVLSICENGRYIDFVRYVLRHQPADTRGLREVGKYSSLPPYCSLPINRDFASTVCKLASQKQHS